MTGGTLWYLPSSNGWPDLGFQASFLKLLPEVLLTILIESWVRQVAPKILTYPSAHYLQLCSNSFKVKGPSAFWANAEAVQLRIPWMWCNYIPESIVIPMMMTVTNYSSIVTGNPFLSFNDFFPWLESSSYFREGHRRSWLMNFIFTRP